MDGEILRIVMPTDSEIAQLRDRSKETLRKRLGIFAPSHSAKLSQVLAALNDWMLSCLFFHKQHA